MNTPIRTVTGLYFNESDRVLVVRRASDGIVNQNLWEPPTFTVPHKQPEEDALVDGFWSLFEAEPIGCTRVAYDEYTVEGNPHEHTTFLVGTIVLKSVLNGTAPFMSHKNSSARASCEPRQIHLNDGTAYEAFDFVNPRAIRAAGFNVSTQFEFMLKRIIDGVIPSRQYS